MVYPIEEPTAKGHKAEFIDYLDSEGFEARVECECGWRELCKGFDAGAIAVCAYEDHVEEVAA